ncbi:MAG: HAD family hydrolase [Desulfobulbaceae bacterium]|nr:HAD family hydrolase [Desulfobulbaceae bacterium]HIJ90768.1 HAD family hydrolase [Deltaproteobacteria bacterium]
MTRQKCVLFDLDGTLVDSLADLADSMNRVLIRQGLPSHPVQAYRYFVGDGITRLVQRALPAENQQDEMVQDCVTKMRQEYALHWADTTRPYPGIAQLLDALTTRGIQMAILSNKAEELTQEVVRTLLPDWHFAAVAGARATIAKKPDPTGALRIANLLDREPTDFLYVGDTNTDMQTARAAQMFAIGALWGFRTADELKKNGAQALLSAPMELCSLLDPIQSS